MIRAFYFLSAVWIGLLVLSLVALAQQVSVVPGDRFAWEMTGPGLELVKSYRYEVEVDGQIRREPLADVTCVHLDANGQVHSHLFECSAPLPTSTLGAHRVRVRSQDISVPGVAAVEGAWSPLFLYVMRPKPGQPAKMRVVKPKEPQ